jgi:serine/threonine protein kinase
VAYSGRSLAASEGGDRRRQRIQGLLPPGCTFADYRIEAVVGWGGMGTVYRARQVVPNRPIALKLIGQELAPDPVARARFLREIELLAALRDAPALAASWQRFLDSSGLRGRRGNCAAGEQFGVAGFRAAFSGSPGARPESWPAT